MKALIDLEPNGKFKIRLAAEGRNDSTLLALLTTQYPSIIDEGSGGVEVPVHDPRSARHNADPAKLDLGKVQVPPGRSVRIREIAARQMIDAKIYFPNAQPSYYELRINGRIESNQVFDLYPGYRVDLTVANGWEHPLDDFSAYIESPPFSVDALTADR